MLKFLSAIVYPHINFSALLKNEPYLGYFAEGEGNDMEYGKSAGHRIFRPHGGYQLEGI